MRVICAWCQHEGRSGLLRVREPLDDGSDTHGICDRHQQTVFEGLPSNSFPAIRWLFIVRSADHAQYAHLSQLLRDVSGTMVILDRRVRERRREAEPVGRERRRFERRVRRPETSGLGYALVRFGTREPTKPTAIGYPGVPTQVVSGHASDSKPLFSTSPERKKFFRTDV